MIKLMIVSLNLLLSERLVNEIHAIVLMQTVSEDSKEMYSLFFLPVIKMCIRLRGVYTQIFLKIDIFSTHMLY